MKDGTDNTKGNGKRRDQRFWVELAERWKGSGRSQREIAVEAGVSPHTFQYWLAKLRAEASGPRGAAEEAPRFVEVRQASGAEVEIACRVRLDAAVVLELTHLPPVAWVRELGKAE